MYVKEQVKEFVHGVQRKLSQKHKRDTSALDSYSSADTLSQQDDSSSCFSISTQASSQDERGRFLKFIRRTASTSSIKRNLFRRGKRADSQRHRLFSVPATPSERIVEPVQRRPARFHGSAGSSQNTTGERTTRASLQDYLDVIDVSARGSSSSITRTVHHDTMSQSQPPFDRESSDTSGTLVTTGSRDHSKSVSGSDSRVNVDLYSDKISETVAPSMADAPQKPDLPHDEEITLAHPSPPPSLPPAPRTATPAQLIRSSPSPAPVVLPRLAAPSMFLPIPNTDPLSALLTKYVPAEQRPRRDVTGECAGRDVHEMVMSNSWRALAKMARDRIVASDPEDLGRILDLWSLRLSSLARLRLTNQASAECTNLFAVLNAVQATSVPGTFPGSGSLPPPAPLPSSPAPPAPSPLSPSGLSGLAQLPGTPSQKPSTLAATPRQGTNELSYPFELTVFHARVHYWSGDPLGYVDALSRILAKCKEKAREEGRIVLKRKELGKAVKACGGGDVESTRSEHTSNGEDESEDGDREEGKEDAEKSTEGTEVQDEEEKESDEEGEESDEVLAAAEANLSMWLERVARVCLILASQMIEMNDYQAAINLLAPLCTHRLAPTFLPTPSAALHSALARVYLLSGNLQKAEEHFSIAASATANSPNGTDTVAMNTALLAAASGNWTRAEEALSEMVAKDPGNVTAINNLAVTRLCQGQIKEGIDLLEVALKTSPSSVVVAEPFLFNLSTLYELRSTAAIDKKRGLLIEVAKWSGDGLKTSCLKMPSS